MRQHGPLGFNVNTITNLTDHRRARADDDDLRRRLDQIAWRTIRRMELLNMSEADARMYHEHHIKMLEAGLL